MRRHVRRISRSKIRTMNSRKFSLNIGSLIFTRHWGTLSESFTSFVSRYAALHLIIPWSMPCSEQRRYGVGSNDENFDYETIG